MKYRAFKHYEEFEKVMHYHYGNEIEIRTKDKSKHHVVTILGWGNTNMLILANPFVKGSLTFEELFEKYQIKHNNRWQPFGVKE